MRRILVILILSVILSSCVTSIDSIKSKSIDIQNDKTVLVFMQIDDLKNRKYFESLLVSELAKRNRKALRSIDIFQPLKLYTDEEIEGIIKEKNIEGYLIIQLVKKPNDFSYIYNKEIQDNQDISRFPNINKNIINENALYFSGNTLPKIYQEYNALYYNFTGKLIWQANGFYKSIFISNPSYVYKKILNKIIDRYYLDFP